MEKTKVVAIVSGGMDSSTLLYDVINMGYDVHVLSFDYNQKHKKELEFAAKTCEKLGVPHKILNLSILNEIAPSALTRDDHDVPEGHYADETMKQTIVANRNMVMLSLATAYAIGIKAKHVFYGAHKGDFAIYPDCRTEFVDALRKAIALCDWNPPTLEAPYSEISKGDIAVRGKELGVPFEDTWSCYKGQDLPCGKCGTCVERLEAMKFAGIEDPLRYE